MREEEATLTWESPIRAKEEQGGQPVRPAGENGVVRMESVRGATETASRKRRVAGRDIK